MVLTVLFGSGLASALLMNDTVAIVGTPLVLRLAREHELDERLMLLALAFGITLGSVPSPIGNPQNLLIANHTSMVEPFRDFLVALGPPTLLNLLLAYALLGRMFRFHDSPLIHAEVELRDVPLARWAKVSLLLVIALVLLRLMTTAVGWQPFPPSWIALAGAAPILLFSRRRIQVLRHIDWATLLFFTAMFVLMESVWNSGFFQALLHRFPVDVRALPTVLGLGVGVSQLISNVPFVALYLPLLEHAGANQASFLALAAGSTLAGNLLILGAASNVIIIQHAEKHGATLGFFQFAKAGIPLTAINLAVYWGWMEWFYR
jgi:Na+/H+ antiporter NhaD/arsenite permease-like protein